jgi:hypothetical protein
LYKEANVLFSFAVNYFDCITHHSDISQKETVKADVQKKKKLHLIRRIIFLDVFDALSCYSFERGGWAITMLRFAEVAEKARLLSWRSNQRTLEIYRLILTIIVYEF